MPRIRRALAYAGKIEGGDAFHVFDHCGDAIMITESMLPLPGPRIVYVNNALEQLCGYASGELLGQTPRIFQGYDTDAVELARLRRDLETSGRSQGEVVNYDKRRREYVLGWAVVPIHDGEGGVRNWLSLQVNALRERANARLAGR